MVNRLAMQPEIPDLHQDGNLFVDEGFDPTLQLISADFDCLMAFLTFSGLDGMPEVDRQTQEDDGHLKGEQDFLCLHGWRAVRRRRRGDYTKLESPESNQPNRQMTNDLP